MTNENEHKSTKPTLSIGESYPDKSGKVNHIVLAICENRVLLAMHEADDNALIQYCVATNPSIYNGILVWDSGEYHLASLKYGNNPFDALRTAINSMQMLYLVHADMNYGNGYQLTSTEEGALQRLQHYLDDNDELQSMAREEGFEALKAQHYVSGVYQDALRLAADVYTITPLEIDERM